MEIVQFESHLIHDLHPAFIEAFSDYDIRFSPTLEDFEIRVLHKLNASSNISPLAVENGQIKGFLLQAEGTYENKKTIYNGGIGVLPKNRRQKIATTLFEHSYSALAENSTDRMLLEVMEKNVAGISLYQNLGFIYTKTFKCFKFSGSIEESFEISMEIKSSDSWDPGRYSTFRDYEPSFIDSDLQMISNFRNEVLLEAFLEDTLVGYIIFQPRVGRISQFGVSPKHRNKGIAKSLFSKCLKVSERKDLTILNVPEDQVSTTSALEKMGFKNQINQIELELTL